MRELRSSEVTSQRTVETLIIAGHLAEVRGDCVEFSCGARRQDDVADACFCKGVGCSFAQTAPTPGDQNGARTWKFHFRWVSIDRGFMVVRFCDIVTRVGGDGVGAQILKGQMIESLHGVRR